MTLRIPRAPKTLAAALIVAVALVGGCTGGGAARSGGASAGSATSAPTTSGATEQTPATTVPPSPTGTSAAGPVVTRAPASQQLPSQTNTEWGRIWDAIPASFPRYPGSSDGMPLAAASATLDVPADVPTAASWMASGLESAGYRTTVSGPGEDGSMTLDSVRPGTACKARTTVAKAGGTTRMTILLGAACPFS